MGRIKNYIGFSQIIFNDAKWFSLVTNSTWSNSYIQITADDSELGFQISLNEYSTLSIPQTVNNAIQASDLDTFVQRWNTSFSNWKSGILQSIDNSFIDYASMYSYYSLIAKDQQFAMVQGYRDIIQGYTQSFADFKNKFLYSARDSCFMVQLEASSHQLIAGDTFFLKLTLTNPTNDTISNINIPLSFLDSSLSNANTRFSISNPNITGITGNIHGSGVLLGSKMATIQWTVTCLSNFTITSIQKYTVGGTTTYSQNAKNISFTLFEDILVSYPHPILSIHYFIPKTFVG